jgi:hypothetical protein
MVRHGTCRTFDRNPQSDPTPYDGLQDVLASFLLKGSRSTRTPLFPVVASGACLDEQNMGRRVEQT